MPVWAAARCTSAASPFFKPLLWNGHTLFDGGFTLNCPAASAYSEAQHIWPGKRGDILLSLGSGTTRNNLPSDFRSPLDTAMTVVGHMTDAQTAWAQFWQEHSQSSSLFRLDPVYHSEFKLDDVNKLEAIQKQTEEWILRKDEEVSKICDHLIAALFFFRPSSKIYNGEQVGEILCRLPIEEGRKLAVGMFLQADLPLFAVQCSDGTLAEVNTNEAFRDFQSTDELRLEVTRRSAVPITSDIRIDIQMRSLDKNAKFTWLPISGSPYLIGEREQSLRYPDMSAALRESIPNRSGPIGNTWDMQASYPFREFEF